MIETVPSGTILQGKYRIERVLGSGGFGHVYLSTDLTTNQPCAVKEYLVTGASGQEQLKHEADVLSHLHHPNLPAFSDAFMEDGRYFIALDYIEGRDLTDHLRMARQHNEAIPLALVMQWVLSICDAVMFLHSQRPSIIHRDIKPDNIRITSNRIAMLVDLGNAKEAADGARTLFFIRHQGTPGYAPPEQYPGGTGTDTRSDVYALGATLYFALTGHEPASVSIRNQRIQQRQPDLPSLQERLAKNPPEVPPEANDLRQFRLGVTKPARPSPRHSKHLAQLGLLPPEILDRLNRIIQRAMAMRPKDRFQFVADFANELRMVMQTLPPALLQPAPSTPPPVDPHSTQPDLQGVYDTIQAAKEQQANQINPTTSESCPRCSSPLAPNALFCPRCGTQLRPSQVQQNVPPRGQSLHGQGMPDLSDEATMIVQYPQSSQAILHQQPPPSPQKPSPGTSQAMRFVQSGPHAAAVAIQAPPQPPPVQPFNVPDTQPGNVRKSSFSMKWVIIVSIILLLLLALMVFLIIQMRSTA